MLILTLSCSSGRKVVEVPVEIVKEVPVQVTTSEKESSMSFDSTYVKDSVDTYRSGDTVMVCKEKYVYRYKYLKDTVVKVDSFPILMREEVPVYVTNTEEIEVNVLTWWQKVLMALGVLFLFCLALKLILKYYRHG